MVLWQKDEGQRRGRNREGMRVVEATRYFDEGEHFHRVVEEEPRCLLTSPKAIFIQKPKRGVGGEFPLIGDLR